MRSQILVPLIALAVAAQACCCCTISGPQPPYTITPSDQTIHQFEERMDSVETDADGSFTVTITEEEITSLIVRELAKQDEPPPIGEPQVHFRNGRAECYATVQIIDSLALPSMVALSITAANGEIEVTVEEVALGPLPIPGSALELLTDALNKALVEGVQGDDVDTLITDIQIGDGEMRISGQLLD